ncbi:galactokinase [Streptomyces sp. NBC_01803]|uniref:galactokinase n=1 Tax=Streptomyces sp. NBC_01803 TaxID=2975946 RepID=UPI002DD9601C|nr:galactokinase [Streptomyces sp. NBC_01803]WSA44602.1 galactokinase [Streptomyces sp. NBC_01803]
MTHEQLFGATPEGHWSAPGRVNLIGEHTDYNDGLALPMALPHTAKAAVSRRADRRLLLFSGWMPEAGPVDLDLDALAPGTVTGWAAYPAGVAWALREAGHDLGGLHISFESDVPVGAGLSSSAALEVVTALALSDLFDLGLAPAALARLARRAENDFAGVPSGILDQMASACCTAGHVLRLDTRDLGLRQIPFAMALEGLRLLVVDTRVRHAHADGAYAARRAECEAGATALGVPALRDIPIEGLAGALARLPDDTLRRRVRHVVTENDRVERVVALLDVGRAREIGPLLTAGHASLRDDFEVSCAELDLAVSASVAAGALGARMTGGGFGGSALVLVAEDTADATGTVRAAIEDAFAAAGHHPPRVFEAIPSSGAQRLPV